MQPQGLKQHQVRQVLGHQKASRLALAQFLSHPLQRPAHRRLVRFLLDMHDRRQDPEQHARVIPGEREVSADNKAIAAAVHGYDAANPARCGQNRKGLNRRRRQIGREEERPAARQQETVARLQSHRVGDALDREPYLTGNDRIAFDAFMLAEADRQPSADVKAA